MQVTSMGDSQRDAALAFLRDRRETSLFLLGNLAEFGPTLSDHLNSGNFKVVLEDGRVTAVFVLARRGNLIVQSDRPAEHAALILDACLEEPVALTGLIGAWDVIAPLHAALQARPAGFTTNFQSREILYRRAVDAAPPVAHPAVRPLSADDFDAWVALHTAFLADEGIPMQGTLAERRTAFEAHTAKGLWWGYFADGRLASMVTLNACVEGVGQLGGVFTPPEHRRRGYSRAALERLFADAAGPLGLHTLVLFTGETNHAAQAMYEALGFERIGHYGLIFGQVG